MEEFDAFEMLCNKAIIVFQAIITVVQIATVTSYLFKSRVIKEIEWLTKLMVLMATFTCTFQLLWTIIFIFEIDQTVFLYAAPFVKIADIVNYSLMFRFVRVQVQLKASVENSKKIMTTIRRSQRIECLGIADLLIYAIAFLLYNISVYALGANEIS